MPPFKILRILCPFFLEKNEPEKARRAFDTLMHRLVSLLVMSLSNGRTTGLGVLIADSLRS